MSRGEATQLSVGQACKPTQLTAIRLWPLAISQPSCQGK